LRDLVDRPPPASNDGTTEGTLSLDAAYDRCRDLHRQHGRTYFLATRLLPKWKRPHVHALYGFTRYTDDLVDTFDADGGLGSTGDPAGRAARLEMWAGRFRAGLSDPGSVADDPILPAVLHTIARFELELRDFDAFLASMRMDLSVARYRDYDELLTYMEGSAAVIGTMMLPILLARPGAMPNAAVVASARESARQLGFAFQLTNFVRDVGEDLRRGRVYLPQADLERFSVTLEDLAAPTAGANLKRLIAFESSRAAEHYRAAQSGIALLPPRSRLCIRLAHSIYGGILGEVERADYDVLVRRAQVPGRRKAWAAIRVASGRP
jgi:15-cis-phytoene synthase